ncbi:MAG TPA: GlsB/YeaQ/YmgE family stress response membrane protein [Gemmataceae bacterium]|nr:GlsB/YeaQ/YmgE family stress response membrane protein [Gemmataceae bacterium]
MDLSQLDLWGVLLLALVAGICGAIGQAIAGYSRGGCLASIALGFIGAVLGVWIFPRLGLPELLTVKIGDMNFPIVWSVIGATVFVAVISLIARRPRYYYWR